jgi:hypothetical protein
MRRADRTNQLASEIIDEIQEIVQLKWLGQYGETGFGQFIAVRREEQDIGGADNRRDASCCIANRQQCVHRWLTLTMGTEPQIEDQQLRLFARDELFRSEQAVPWDGSESLIGDHLGDEIANCIIVIDDTDAR